jgi:zinc transporter, ZIP family
MSTFVIATRRLFGAEPAASRRAPQLAILVATAALAAAVLQAGAGAWLAAAWRNPVIGAALGATLITALATGLGALPVLLIRQLSDRARDTLLGFGAGVMLAASFFSLLTPALEAGAAQTGSAAAGGMIGAAGLALGALFLFAADRLLPHEHTVKGAEGPAARGLSRAWLFVFAIALHNLPEGLAVGIAQADGTANATAVTFGIALQNMPEGLVVAVALLAIGLAPVKAFAIALLTGMVEPLGGVIGAGMVTAAYGLLPWGLAFAAGAMLFVVSHEIIPETHRNGNERVATAGLIAGFIVMTLSDTMLT